MVRERDCIMMTDRLYMHSCKKYINTQRFSSIQAFYAVTSRSTASNPSRNMWAWWGWKMRAGRKRIVDAPQIPIWNPMCRQPTSSDQKLYIFLFIIVLTSVSQQCDQLCSCINVTAVYSTESSSSSCTVEHRGVAILFVCERERERRIDKIIH